MDYSIFTDNWWFWFVKEYGISIGIIWGILKAIAVLDPSNKTNKVLDTFRSLLPGSKENKELARRAEDRQ